MKPVVCMTFANMLYVRIPKNATTSIVDVVREKLGGKSALSDQVNQSKYWKFTVIREPMSRFVTGYMEYRYRQIFSKKLSDYKINQYEMINEILTCDDIHMRPQTEYLKAFDKIDKHLLFETVNDEFYNMFGYKLPKRHVRDSQWKDHVIRSIDNDVMNAIYERYKEDFELYKEVCNGHKT